MTTDIDKAAREAWAGFITNERLFHIREELYIKGFRAGAEWREAERVLARAEEAR